MKWIKDIVSPQSRKWEDFYRNRWQHDKVVRGTHGVNCTGGCSWMIYVKDGIVTWELQAVDYPSLESGLPPYEPRGCQRGISSSWYIYSHMRVKYPYIRGEMIDLWRKAKEKNSDPVDAWQSLVDDKEARSSYQQARGKGGFRRATWDEALEIIAAASVHTIKKYGPDRVIGFSPIPAMSQLSYAAGSRYLQLSGGVNLSFYDWYCDLPAASPEVWGEQTDVCESADWHNSKYILVMGANLGMTRTPDVHFVSEARQSGTKLVVLSPDFSMVSKYADWWVPVNAGQDGAFWMAVNHVILKEFYVDRQVPYFTNYLKRYTDSPFLVTLKKTDTGFKAGRLLKASALQQYKDAENSDWKYLVYDANKDQPVMPKGTLGFRWAKEDAGKWNLEMKDAVDEKEIEPLLTLIDNHDEVIEIEIMDFAGDKILRRGVPVKYIDTDDGRIPVATGFDLLMAQFGVGRGLSGEYPESYDDVDPFTPAWQEGYTGVDRDTVINFAREWSSTAEKTEGKCMIIIGAGINHWYHSNLIYKAGIVGLMLTGCVGKNGGGLNHYVGQEKLAPMAPWATIAMALDWGKPPRLQNAPSFHYIHSDQWRYEKNFTDYCTVPKDEPLAQGHTADMQVKAVKNGWLPFYPQFERNSIELAREAAEAGAGSDAEISAWVATQLAEGKLSFSVENPDAPENWPRVWLIWRGNAIMSSAKGHEYFLKHYLGTHHSAIAEDVAGDVVEDIQHDGPAPEGKMDLVVDLNFRMDTSALYSDIVLPAASWYEKNDLNSTDMHSFIHPLQEAVPPTWESKSDWDAFKAMAAKLSELARKHLPEPVKDVVCIPLQHDTPDEMAQVEVKDWSKGECDPAPGKSMPKFIVVERDYVNLYNRFKSFGPIARRDGIGVHGNSWSIEDFYDDLLENGPCEEWNGNKYPSFDNVVDAINTILYLAPETNGQAAYRAFESEEKHVGLPLKDLAEDYRGVKTEFKDLCSQPRRLLTSPCWTGLMDKGRAYSAYCMNVERLVPWRTLTGRQHFYLDHDGYIAFGENLPTYKPTPRPADFGDMVQSKSDDQSIVLNYLTPHGKWHIHSTFFDNEKMLTLSKGVEPFWMNDQDAATVGIKDNDWIEAHNDHGVVVTRCVLSARIPRGICMFYHSPERTISVPKSPLRGNRRAGGHNSLTRARLKPLLMVGGYGQFTYAFNYWGPIGVNRDTHVLVRKLDKVEW